MSTTVSGDQWKDKGKYFQRADENSIFYVSEGGSEHSILFLHGFPTSSWDWSRVWSQLKAYHLIAPDFLGYGYSDKPKKYNYSIFDQADIIEELLKYLSVKKVHLVAHDFGDSVAQEILRRANEGSFSFDIRSAFFLNGGLFMKHSSPRPIQKLLLSPVGFIISRFLSYSRFRKSFSEVFAKEYKPSEEELKQFWKIISHKNGHRIAHLLIRYIHERFANDERWTLALKNSKTPLKMVIGAQDPVSGIPIAERFKEVSPDSEVLVLDHVGHYPQTEDPERIAGEILSFIQAYE